MLTRLWWQRWGQRLQRAWIGTTRAAPRPAAARTGWACWRYVLSVWWGFGAPQRHRHVYAIYQRWLCPAACEPATVDDEGCHEQLRHVASSRAQAERWVRTHPHAQWARIAASWWEVWETAVDAYDPFERADDEVASWYYLPEGRAVSDRELEAWLEAG